MKKGWKYRILQVGGALALCLVLALGAILPAVAGNGVGSAATSMDFGVEGMSGSQEISEADLLRMLYGISVTPAEKVYLDTVLENSFRYSTNIPEDRIDKIYNGEAGTLDVSMEAYTYTATNGAQVTWIPTHARIGTQAYALTEENGIYSCQFVNLYHSDDFDMEVDYVWELTLSDERIGDLPNAAYLAGVEALGILNAHDAELSLYNAALKRHNTWVAYQQSVVDYEAYLVAKAEYDEKKAAYDVYAKEYEDYSAELAKWQAWRDYWNANKFYTEKDANGKTGYDKWLTYDAYLKELEKVKAKLEVMELLFVTDSNGWQLYGGIMGNSVTQVLERKDELSIAGISEITVDQANDATVQLRPLLKQYGELRKAKYGSDYQRYKALYDFYCANYNGLMTGFGNLYSALRSMYTDSFVAAVRVAGMGEKLPHYQQFIGQLYIVATCLNDEFRQVEKNSDWKLNKYIDLSVVEPCQHLKDTHAADPAKPTAPKMPVSEPEVIVFVPQAQKPSFAEVEKPTEPAYVEEPTPVPEVTKPTDYTQTAKPDWWEAEHPGTAPAAPDMSNALRALAAEVKAGTLKERSLAGKAKSLRFEKTAVYPVSISNLMTVTFYGLNDEILDRQQIEYGTEVIYKGRSPYVVEDPYNRYDFQGWIYADGTVANLASVTRSVSLYAKYKVTPRIYTATWVVDGMTYQSSHRYGEIPVCPFPLDKASTPQYSYEFGGWDREITPITESTTYTGAFTAIPRSYTVTWRLDGTEVQESYLFGEIPAFKESTAHLPGDYKYTFIGWDKAPQEVTGDAVYTARYTKTPLATTANGEVLQVTYGEGQMTLAATAPILRLEEAIAYALATDSSLSVTWEEVTVTLDGAALQQLSAAFCKQMALVMEAGERGTVLHLEYRSSAGRPLAVAPTALLTVAPSGEDRYYTQSNGEWIVLDPAAGALTVVGRVDILLCKSYSVRADRVENCDVESLVKNAVVGERVHLDLPCAFGYEVVGATVTLGDGTPVAMDGLSFLMPSGDVRVTLTVGQIVYHVSFTVNGTVISEADYFLGDTIRLPADPSIPTDDQYQYTFVGWTPSPTVAAGEERNPVYEAVFSKAPVSGEDPFNAGANNNGLFTKTIPIAASCVVLLVGVILLIRFRKPLMAKLKKQPRTEKTEKGTTDGTNNAV